MDFDIEIEDYVKKNKKCEKILRIFPKIQQKLIFGQKMAKKSSEFSRESVL